MNIHVIRRSGCVVLVLLLLAACSGQPEESSHPQMNTPEQPQPVAVPPGTTTVKPPQSVKLTGKFMGEDAFGTPQYQVVLHVDGTSRAIDTVAACETISRDGYDQYEIPKEAVAACGGWWAGGGDYYYAVIENNKAVVYQGWQDEGQDDSGYHWKKMKKVR